MHVYFFVVLATNYQIITGQKRACPPLVPANVSIKEVKYTTLNLIVYSKRVETFCPLHFE